MIDYSHFVFPIIFMTNGCYYFSLKGVFGKESRSDKDGTGTTTDKIMACLAQLHRKQNLPLWQIQEVLHDADISPVSASLQGGVTQIFIPCNFEISFLGTTFCNIKRLNRVIFRRVFVFYFVHVTSTT